MGRLDGKIAVVTGAGSGYGRAIARAFAREGAKVACLSRTTKIGVGFEKGDDYTLPTAEDIAAHGGEAVYISCDVADEASVKAAFEEVDKIWGGVDILVNNAGIYHSGVPIDEMTGEWLEKILNVNLFGSYNCAREALRRMRAQGRGGRVIQIASTAAFLATAGEACYDISKGACLMLARSIAAEYGEYGITCNTICPAVGKTPMNTMLYANDVFRNSIMNSNAMHMWVEPSTVAYYSVFFASDESAGVTGTEAVIDGGARACGGGHSANMKALFDAAGLSVLYTEQP